MSTTGTAPAELRSFVERIQRLEGKLTDINSDKRDVYAEAKSKDFDVAALKAVVSYLRKDRDKAVEQQILFDLYLAQVVGASEPTPANKRISGLPSANAGHSNDALARARARDPEIPIDADATGSPRHVVEPAPPPRPPAIPGAGSSFPEPDPRDDIRNQPFYRGAPS